MKKALIYGFSIIIVTMAHVNAYVYDSSYEVCSNGGIVTNGQVCPGGNQGSSLYSEWDNYPSVLFNDRIVYSNVSYLPGAQYQSSYYQPPFFYQAPEAVYNRPVMQGSRYIVIMPPQEQPTIYEQPYWATYLPDDIAIYTSHR